MSEQNSPISNQHIIIYDGVCHLCNTAVKFIIRRDSGNKFCFVPMQSQFAQELVGKRLVENTGDDTIILIKNEQVFERSDAALEIANELDGFWHLLSIFKIVPVSIRDWFYRFIARNRYRMFGRSDVCIVPTEDIKQRFRGLELD